MLYFELLSKNLKKESDALLIRDMILVSIITMASWIILCRILKQETTLLLISNRRRNFPIGSVFKK